MKKNSWQDFIINCVKEYATKYQKTQQEEITKMIEDFQEGVTPDLERYELPTS